MSMVLLIDDDKERMKYYVTALKWEGFSVKQVYGPDDALEYANDESSQKPDIILLDIMMPPGKRYEGRSDCEKGLCTGLLLYPELKEHYKDVPFIVLTNKITGNSEFADVAPNVIVLEKINTPPFEMVDMVKEVLSIV